MRHLSRYTTGFVQCRMRVLHRCHWLWTAQRPAGRPGSACGARLSGNDRLRQSVEAL